MNTKIYLISNDLDYTVPTTVEFGNVKFVNTNEQLALHELKHACSYLNINGAHFEFTEDELSSLKNKVYSEKVDKIAQALPDFNKIAEIAKPTQGYMLKYEDSPVVDIYTCILNILKPGKVYFIVRCYAEYKFTVTLQERLIDYIMKLGMNEIEHLSDIVNRLPDDVVTYMLDNFERAEWERQYGT